MTRAPEHRAHLAESLLRHRQRAHEVGVGARAFRGPLADVLVRVSLQEAARSEAMARDALAEMTAEADRAGGPVSYPLTGGWAVTAWPTPR